MSEGSEGSQSPLEKDPLKKELTQQAQSYCREYLDRYARSDIESFRSNVANALREIRVGKPESMIRVLESMASDIKGWAGGYIPEVDDAHSTPASRPTFSDGLWAMNVQQLAWDMQAAYGIPVELSKGDRRMLKGLSRFRKADNDGKI